MYRGAANSGCYRGQNGPSTEIIILVSGVQIPPPLPKFFNPAKHLAGFFIALPVRQNGNIP